MIESKDIIPEGITISDALKFGLPVLSLLLSIYTLYVTQWRNARLQIFVGEHVNLGHFKEGNFHITLPVVFINNGVRVGVIRRVALLIKGSGSDDGYLLEPYFYQSIREDGHFKHESQPVPITIAGKQNLTKQILFRSSEERPTEFQLLNTGAYTLTLLGWTSDSGNPALATSFSFDISLDAATKLHSDFKNRTGNTTRITQKNWFNWTAKSLTREQIKAFLK